MTSKKRKKGSKRKKAEETLHERVTQTVGRGLDAYFTTEAEPPPDDESASAEVTPDDLAAFMDREANAAGDALAEVGMAEVKQPAPVEDAGEASATEGTPSVTEETLTERPAATSTESPKEEPPSSPEPATEEELAVLVDAVTERFSPRDAVEAAPTPSPSLEAAPPEPSPQPGVTPPDLRPGGTLLEHPMTVEVQPPGPGEPPAPETPPAEPTVTPTLPPEAIRERVNQERFQEINEEIDRLYEEVPRRLAHNEALVREALEGLRVARAILWTAPEQVVDAEYRVHRVKALITRYRQSEEWGRVYGTRLLIYELAWLFVLLGGFIALQLGQTRLINWVNSLLGPGADTTFTAVIVPFLTSLMWGGIGGVVGALYSLWWHVSQLQDFDRRYTMWYLIQPIMGFILGGLVFLIIGTGFLVLQGTIPSPEATQGIQLFPPLVAALGGFRQKFVYELLERIIRVLTPSGES